LSLGMVDHCLARGEVDRLRTELQRIARASDRMERLLSDLLNLSRAAHASAPFVEITLGGVVRSAIDAVAAKLAARSVSVTVERDLPGVRGDPAGLEKVFTNLIENAIKFMGDQPAPRIEIGVTKRRNHRVIFVRDNGSGIAPEFHEKVFGLFERIEPRIEGTGIGLAIVRRIVEAHDGRVWVESDG